MPNWRKLSGLGLVVLALAVAGAIVVQLSARPKHPAGPITATFDLATHSGKRLSSRDLSGQPYVAVFGFTQCPDVCPTTLQEIGGLISGLGADADRLRYVFITVDPERDTQDVLKSYLSAFDPHIVGLTGTLDEISATAKSFRAFFQKVPSSGSYTMSHTSSVYLMDGRGTLVSTMSLQDPEDKKIARLRSLLK